MYEGFSEYSPYTYLLYKLKSSTKLKLVLAGMFLFKLALWAVPKTLSGHIYICGPLHRAPSLYIICIFYYYRNKYINSIINSSTSSPYITHKSPNHLSCLSHINCTSPPIPHTYTPLITTSCSSSPSLHLWIVLPCCAPHPRLNLTNHGSVIPQALSQRCITYK